METNDDLLKRAKKAVKWRLILTTEIPEEFHVLMVNLECCSKYFLSLYIRDYLLSPDAQVRLIEKYEKEDPELILHYLRFHRNVLSTKATLKLIECKNIKLLAEIEKNISNSLTRFHFGKVEQLAVVKTNDAEYFKKFRDLFPNICSEAVDAIIEQQNVQMFNELFSSVVIKKASISSAQQKKLVEQNNQEMIDCFLRHYSNFNFDVLRFIIENENTTLFQRLLEKQKFIADAELFLAEKGSKNLIARYLKRWPMCFEAQLKLVDLGHTDLLKLHYLRYGLSERAIIYYASLNYFKNSLGV